MARTLVDLEVHETKYGMNAYTRRDVNEIIDERIAILKTNNHNRLTRYTYDGAIEVELIKMVIGIVNCNDEDEANEMMQELVEFGRKEELMRFKGDGGK